MTAACRRGFTLVELAIVIAIVGAFLAVVFRSAFVMDRASAASLVADIKDVRSAMTAFKERYHYLPGDFPVDKDNPEIPDVSDGCRKDGDNAGNGNGLIEATESSCAAEHLIRAGLLKGDPAAPFL